MASALARISAASASVRSTRQFSAEDFDDWIDISTMSLSFTYTFL